MKNSTFTHTPTSWETVLEVRTNLSRYISGHRLAHTLSVEKQAVDMAKIIFCALGVDQAYMLDVSCAALLHDITKHFSLEEQLKFCENHSIEICKSTESSCAMLHSKTAAFLAKQLFDINDCVFNAIYCHTVGGNSMDIIAKIIFLADYIEPTRTAESCKNVRELFYSLTENGNMSPLKALDFCIIKSIDGTLDYLIQQNLPIHIQTIITRNGILEDNAFFK